MRPESTHHFDFFIQWHLTERCNLRCRHCYQGRMKGHELRVGEVLREIDGATEMFRSWEKAQAIKISPSIHFTGGEPILYKGFWDVLRHASGLGYGLAIMTNGTRIGEMEAAAIRELGIGDVQVSIEGPPSIHDAIRGEGAFAAARKGIRRLVEAGNRVSANVTLSRLNVNAISETISSARDAGISAVGFSRMVPCGKGRVMLDQFLAPEELRTAYERVLRLQEPGIKILSCDPLFGTFSGFVPPAEYHLTLAGCSAGFSGLTITSNGDVMACRRIGIRAGSLREKSLREIWVKSRHLLSLRKRENYRGRCGTCSRWPACRGCRAVAYAFSKARGRADLFSDDPQCWHIHPPKNPTRSSIDKQK